MQVPIDATLPQVVEALKPAGEEVYVTDLSGDKATVVVRKWVSGEGAAERAESDLRLKIAAQLAESAT